MAPGKGPGHALLMADDNGTFRRPQNIEIFIPDSNMVDLAIKAASATSTLLLPLLFLQGRYVRRRTLRLPGASGPKEGRVVAADPPMRLLVIGESTVAGVGAPNHETALTGQTATALSQATGRSVVWHALGEIGATAKSTRTQLVPDIQQSEVDVIVIALGVNDTIRFNRPGKWRKQMQQLIFALHELVGAAMIVLSPVPPMNRFPSLPQPLRSVFGLRALTLDRALQTLAGNLPGVIHASIGFGGGEELFCADRFHPSQKGYSLWGQALAAEILKIRKG